MDRIRHHRITPHGRRGRIEAVLVSEIGLRGVDGLGAERHRRVARLVALRKGRVRTVYGGIHQVRHLRHVARWSGDARTILGNRNRSGAGLLALRREALLEDRVLSVLLAATAAVDE